MDSTTANPAARTGAAAAPAGWLVLLLRAVAVIYCLWVLIDLGIVVPWGFNGIDYLKHWLAARALLHGASVYLGDELYMGFNYPQWMAFVYCWLGLMSYETSQHVWDLLNLGMMLGVWILAWRGLNPRRAGAPAPRQTLAQQGIMAGWGVSTALALALYRPATTCLPVANVDPYNAILVMALVVAVVARRDGVAGVLWVLLILCKLLPLSLIVPFVFWRRWRLLGFAAGALAVYGLLLVVTGRVGYEVFFWREIVPKISFHWRNISMSAPRLAAFLTGQFAAYTQQPAVFQRYVYGVLLTLAVSSSLGLLWMRRRGMSLVWSLELALVMIPLFAPLLEYHHYVFAFPAAILQLRRWTLGRMPRRFGLIYLVYWLILGQYFHLADNWPGVPMFVQLLPVIPALVMALTIVWETARTAPEPGESAPSASFEIADLRRPSL